MFAKFLSAVTGISKEYFLNAEYIGGELTKTILTERGKVADIIVKVDSARQIVVEMNKFDPGNIFEKNASYAFSLFNKNTKIGKRIWSKIILINIDNFNRFGTDLPILDFKIRDKTGEYEVDIFHSYNIILANWKNPNYNIDKEITKYLEFITSKEFSELKIIAEGDEDYMAAFRKVEDLSTDPNFIGYYDYEQAHQDDVEIAKYTGMKKGIE